MKMMSSALASILALTLISMTPSAAFAQDTPELPANVTDFALFEAADDHVVGSEDAAITMITWASVTCPHCGNWFSKEWPAVKADLVDTGKLRFVFREFPTAPAQLAMTGFLMANCAPSEDFMSVIEYQMENQEQIFEDVKEGRGREVYNEIAKLAGMEEEDAVTACLRNPDMLAHIQLSSDRAVAAEVRGVPAFFINGEAYKGPSDAKSLVELITDMDEKGLSAIPESFKASPKEDHKGHEHD